MCKNKKQVEKLLKENKRGLTIQDISNETNLTRNTISIILAELKGENKIEIRVVGRSKLNYWREIKK